MSEIKWLPCPFCGGNPKLISPRGRISWIQCCGFETKTFDSKQKAIEFWNTRKPMERIVEQLENVVAKRIAWIGMPDSYCDAIDNAIDIVRNGGKE